MILNESQRDTITILIVFENKKERGSIILVNIDETNQRGHLFC